MTTIVKATFKGQDGSCGYKNGKEYTLKVTHQNNGRGIITVATTTDSGGYCDYNSFHAFMRNWDNIKNS